jgi:hypothetical protein
MDDPEGCVKVMVGASYEVGSNNWRKQDTSLDETDLGRMLAANGVDYAEVSDRIRTPLVFMALLTEAERLTWAGLVSTDATEHARNGLAVASDKAKSAMTKLLSSLS